MTADPNYGRPGAVANGGRTLAVGRVLAADPQTQTLPYVPGAEFAKLLGFEGIKVIRLEDVGAAWDRGPAANKEHLPGAGR